MNEEIEKEILAIYETLIENGVSFYYGSEIIPIGEVTSFNILGEEMLEIELDGFNIYEVNTEDFIEYHSKEGANYHTWPDIRKFDKRLVELFGIDN